LKACGNSGEAEPIQYYFEESTLPNHTFYQPLQSAFIHSSDLNLRVPVIIWGNGGCSPLGLSFQNFLGEVASYGALAIATGPAFVDPDTYLNPVRNQTGSARQLPSLQHPEAMTAAIDWVVANAGQGKWQHVDPTRIGVWGQSCGGAQHAQEG
jgi:dienelactone hydrolase